MFLDPNMLSHTVYFKLKDSSKEAAEALTTDCQTYLKNHPGVQFFAAGPLAPEFNRPVNDHDFDVCLHVVFDTKESHDSYQVAKDHLTFIDRNKESWENIRVFDAYVD